MSISNFEDEIQNQVNSYQHTVETLRDSQLTQRNRAIAGIQSQVEKWGEVAKLGFEIPVAVEGLKLQSKVFSTAKKYFTGAKDLLKGAEGDEGFSKVKNLLSGGEEGLAARAKGAIKFSLSKASSQITKPTLPTPDAGESKIQLPDTGETKLQLPDVDESGMVRGRIVRAPNPTRQMGRNLNKDLTKGDGVEMTSAGETKSSIFKDGSKGGFESEISSKGAIQAGGNETKSSLAQTLSGDAEEEGGNLLKSAATTAGEEVAAASDFSFGAFLESTGILAPLGVAADILGAVTEIGAVAGGVVGGIKSLQDSNEEEDLRNKPLPSVTQHLDIGGRIGVPEVA